MDRVKVAVIGLGAWGECHVQVCLSLPQVQLVAICDNRPERLREIGDKHGIERCYTNYEQMITNHPDIQVVHVVTNEKDHLLPTLFALKQGKHVLVEKPVSTSAAEAREMLRAAERAKRVVVPGHLLRFDPRYAHISDSLRSGKLGLPVSFYFKRSREKYLFDIFKRTHTVYELMVHDLDLAVWYAGSRVKTVRAHGLSVVEEGIPAVLWANLEFENGVFAVLQSNWSVPNEAGIAIFDSVEVIGDKGIAHFETKHAGLEIWNDQGRRTDEFQIHAISDGLIYGTLREQVAYVADSIRGGRDWSRVSMTDAVHVAEIADAIIESSVHGGKCIPGVINSDPERKSSL